MTPLLSFRLGDDGVKGPIQPYLQTSLKNFTTTPLLQARIKNLERFFMKNFINHKILSKNSPEWPFLAFSKNNFNLTVFLLSAKKTICLFRAVFFIHRMCDSKKPSRGVFRYVSKLVARISATISATNFDALRKAGKDPRAWRKLESKNYPPTSRQNRGTLVCERKLFNKL